MSSLQTGLFDASRVISRVNADDASLLDQVRQVLRRVLGPPLKAFHAPIDEWLGSLPMWVAVSCAVGLYLVALIWVWGIRREFIFRGAPDQQAWRDLRVWATILVIPYVAVYLLLGR